MPLVKRAGASLVVQVFGHADAPALLSNHLRQKNKTKQNKLWNLKVWVIHLTVKSALNCHLTLLFNLPCVSMCAFV
jgi:hypothetical protein